MWKFQKISTVFGGVVVKTRPEFSSSSSSVIRFPKTFTKKLSVLFRFSFFFFRYSRTTPFCDGETNRVVKHSYFVRSTQNGNSGHPGLYWGISTRGFRVTAKAISRSTLRPQSPDGIKRTPPPSTHTRIYSVTQNLFGTRVYYEFNCVRCSNEIARVFRRCDFKTLDVFLHKEWPRSYPGSYSGEKFVEFVFRGLARLTPTFWLRV